MNSFAINDEYLLIPDKGESETTTLSTGTEVTLAYKRDNSCTVTVRNAYEDIEVTYANFRASSWSEIMLGEISGVELQVYNKAEGKWTEAISGKPEGYSSQGENHDGGFWEEDYYYISFRYKTLPGYGNVQVDYENGSEANPSHTGEAGWEYFAIRYNGPNNGYTKLSVTATPLTYEILYDEGTVPAENMPDPSGPIYSVSGASGTFSNIFVPNKVPTAEGKVFNGWIIEESDNDTVYWPGDTIALTDISGYANRNSQITFVAQWADEGRLPDKVSYTVRVFLEDTTGEYEHNEVSYKLIYQEDKVGEQNQELFIISPEDVTDINESLEVPIEWEKYDLVDSTGQITLSEIGLTYDFYYRTSYEFTIEYVDENGNQIEGAAPVTEEKRAGEAISANPKEFPNYKVQSGSVDPENAGKFTENSFSGIMPAENVTVTYVYKEKTGREGYNLVSADARFTSGNYEQNGTSTTKYLEAGTRYAKGDVMTVNSDIPELENHVFVTWFDKERGGGEKPAQFHSGGDEVEYNYSETDYTFDAIWATISAEDITKVYDGQDTSITAEASIYTGELGQTYLDQIGDAVALSNLQYKVGEDGEWDSTNPTFKNVGEYTVFVKANVTVNGTVKEQVETSATVKIIPKAVTFTGESGTRTYTGSEIELNGVEVDGLVDGHTYNVTASAKGTLPNTYTGTITAKDDVVILDGETDVTGNYTITTTPGQLIISAVEKAITITASSDEKVYDGKALTNAEYTYTDDVLLEGDELQAVVEGSATNVGDEGVNRVTSYKVMRGDVDVTSAYTFTDSVDGKLTITPKAVTFTGESGTRTYTGSEIELNGVEVDGLVDGHTYNVTASAKGTLPNTYTGTITAKDDVVILDGETDVTGNYTITTTPGQLIISAVEKAITITASSDEKVYDGKALTNAEYTYTDDVLLEGDELQAVVEGSATNVGDEGVNRVTSYKVMRGDVDVTSAYTFTDSVDGKLTITPRILELTGNSGTKEYTGRLQSVTGYTVGTVEGTEISQLVDGHVITAEASASGTEAGEYPGTITKADDVKVEDAEGKDVTANYTITTTAGKLTITTAGTLSVTLNGKTKGYDGTAHYLDAATTSAASGETTIQYALSEDAEEWVDSIRDLSLGQTDAGSKVIYVKATNPNYSNTATGSATLMVTPRTLVLTGNSDTKEYTGQQQSVTGYTVGTVEGTEISQLVDGHVITAEASASGTEAGEYPGTITKADDVKVEDAEGKDVTANYTITTTAGKLTITKVGTLTVTLNDKTEGYDGTAHYLDTATTSAASGETTIQYALSEDAEEWVESISDLSLGQTDAGSKVIYVKATNPNYSNTATGSATLTVTPRTVTLTSASDTKVYDGDELTNDTVTVTGDGWADGEGATYTVTGSQTLVGESLNTFDYKPNEGTKVSNYVIEIVEGTLTVTDGTGDNPIDPDDVLKKTHDNTGYGLGDTVTFNIQVTNIYDEVKTITVKEIDGVTLSQSVFEDVQPGEVINATATYKITEEDILEGKFVNTVTARFSDGKTFENTDTVTTEEPNGHLTVMKETTSTPANGKTYALGETIAYKITVTNDGNLTITDIAVTDELTGNTGEDAWTIASLAPGGSKTFEAKYTVTEKDILAGKVVNVATATGTSPDPKEPEVPVEPGTKEDTTDDVDATLTVTKETTSTPANGETYALGETITYTITVKNDGNVSYSNVVVTDELAGAQIQAGEGYTVGEDGKALIAELAVGTEVKITATYVVTEEDILAGFVKNAATAEGDPIDDPKNPDEPKTPEGGDEEEDTTDDVDATLTVTKTSDVEEGETVSLGDIITYTITVKNDGNVPYTNVAVADELEGAQIQAGEGYTVGEDGKALIAELAVGAEVKITATYMVTEEDILTGFVKNAATAEGDPIDDPKNPDEPKTPEGGDEEEDTTDDVDATLTVTKETTSTPANGETYALGETITYTITVKNDGNVSYSNVVVTDELAGAQIQAGEGYTVGEDGKALIAELAVGIEVKITATYVVTEEDILAGFVKNAATAEGDPIDDPKNPDEPKTPEGGDEEEDTTDDVDATLTVTKETTSTPANGETYALGETITYTITVKNDGNVPYPNVVVTDELAGAQIQAGEGYTVGEDGKALIAELAVGAEVKITATYVVTEEDILAGSVKNTATAEGDPIDDPKNPDEPKTPEGGDDEEETTDEAAPSVSITKTSNVAEGETVSLGDVIEYTVTVANTGNISLNDVTLTDVMTGVDGVTVLPGNLSVEDGDIGTLASQ